MRRSTTATNIATSSYLDRYELVGLLGVGGMGSVYRVHDLILEEEVALKIMRKDLSNSPEALARFRREVKLARRITHPNVVRIYDIGENAGEHFYTMECVLGDSLSSALDPKHIDLAKSVGILCQVAEGIAASHKAGVIHRDLKPDNILVARDGRVAITDFGVALATEDTNGSTNEQLACGTPQYMAPEQLENQPLTLKTDLYALGLIAYELLCGETPWPSSEAPAKPLARLSKAPKPLHEANPSVPLPLAGLVDKLLRRDPTDRPVSAREVARLLSELESSIVAESALIEMPHPQPSLPEIATTQTLRARSLALIPFKNQGEAPDGIIADTMTEDLASRLTSSPNLRVTALTRPKEWEDSREFGRRTNADVVASGTILRCNGTGFSVHVQLVEVQRGFVLWSADYRCQDSELFELVADIAVELADTLTVELKGRRTPNAHHIDNVEAFFLARRSFGEWLPESVSAAMSQLRHCLERSPYDPGVIAYMSLAMFRLRAVDLDTPETLSEEARELARHALDLDPHLAEAHLALGTGALYDANWEEAARRCEEAVRCSPATAGAHHVLGYLKSCAGDVEQGLHMLDVALRIDPRYLAAAWDASYTAAMLEQHTRAFDYLDRADMAYPNHPNTAVARLRISSWMADHLRLVHAREAAYRCRVSPNSYYETILHLFLEAQPDRQVGSLSALASSTNVPPMVRAQLMQLVAERELLNGQAEVAWSALRTALPYTVNWLWFARCPSLERLRRDPAFVSVASMIQSRARSLFA